ncbi:hypothetical protein PS865_04866 [Pseudomonas fluorescens]|uniref:head-tail connector protein n=1 Tax=Pseudomonas fluorescens TaxID=294 RepID=UPI0012420651|nr:head-tail connector protein [Pseudomonas fluorescens]VVP41193.1 hypothetical protein PS865_04866 [Pseudomonas fluorescens]
MSVITIERAMKHLRAEFEDVDDVQSKLDAAEDAAEQYLNRKLFVDGTELWAALTTVITLRSECRVVLDSALSEASLIDNIDDRLMAERDAQCRYKESLRNVAMISRGIVLNKSITAACLLMLGHLWANREDTVTGINTSSVIELPHGSRSLLFPYRVDLGV